jgi:hypothetical protein
MFFGGFYKNIKEAHGNIKQTILIYNEIACKIKEQKFEKITQMYCLHRYLLGFSGHPLA